MPGFDPDAYLADKTGKEPSSFDPDQYLADKSARDTSSNPGVLSRLGSGTMGLLNSGLKKLDSYTGAPSREFVNDLLKGSGVGEAAQGFANKFGADPDTAPTADEVMTRAGVPHFSARQMMAAVGGPIGKAEANLFPDNSYVDKTDMSRVLGGAAMDWTVPASFAGEGLKAAGSMAKAIPGVERAAEAIKATPIGEQIGEAIQSAKQIPAEVASRMGEAVTGIPAQEIRTYASHLKEINAAIEKYGPDLSEASDDVRKGFASEIAAKRQALNDAISSSLKDAPRDPTIDISPVIDRLKDAKAKLNPVFDEAEINHIDDMLTKVQKASVDGKMDPANLFDTKNFLQSQAAPSYMRNGMIFVPGKKAQQAAKYGAAEARKLVNQVSPEIAEANNQLSMLHSVEDKINKNLITPGKPDAALIGAGANESSRNYKNLARLQEIIGKDFVGDAQKLAAQRTFTKPPILPMDSTGKTATRAALGSGLGWLIGGPGGAAVGAAATSPATLKGLINTGAAVRRAAPAASAAYPAAMGLMRANE